MTRWPHRACAVLVTGLVLIAPGRVEAACYSEDAQLSPKVVADFTSDPGRILQQFPGGGGEMISRVRDLAASNPTTLSAILGLIPKANKEQKAAFGSALAQAARICLKPDQAYANQIQQAIVETNDQELIVAYSAASGDSPIAAVGPAGVATGGGLGGQSGPSGVSGTGFGTVNSAPVTFGAFSLTTPLSTLSVTSNSTPARRVSP